MLMREQTLKNAEKYLSYFGKILDLKKVEVYYNSEGLDAVNFCAVGELAKANKLTCIFFDYSALR
jgi:tyrosyl-tRNA synthetase